jgi:DNA polymerase-1
MRVNAIQARMMLNGWGVNTERLAARVRGEEERVEAARQKLAEWGVPLNRPSRIKIKLKREWPDQSMSITEARDLANAYPEIAVEKGVATLIPGEPYKSPWSTETGREAIERAFHDAGAEHVPHTESGALALSSDALGEGNWIDHTGKSRPGMLKFYGHLPGVRILCETLALATGATSKYAEISRFLTPEGRVHAQTGAPQASWRWATYAPALANLSKTDRQVREVFDESADGLVHLTCDLSQVDMRVMAALSQDPAYMEIFAPGRDAHMEMAQVYFGEQSPATRKKTKAFNHAGNYGQGVSAVSERTGLPLEVCQRIAEAKAAAYPRLTQYIAEVRDLASSGALLDNGFGLLMRPDPERSWTQGPALMGQGGARDVMTTSILRLWDQAPWMREGLRAVIHDEVVVAVPRERVTEAQEALRAAFTWEWRGVPILCEVSEPGETWRDCYPD